MGAGCWIHTTFIIDASRYTRNGAACGYHTAPSSTLLENNSPPMAGGIIKVERGSVWFSCCLVGLWNEKKNRRGRHEPCHSLCFLVPLHPHTFSHPPSLPTCQFWCLHLSRRGEAAIVTCRWWLDSVGGCCFVSSGDGRFARDGDGGFV